MKWLFNVKRHYEGPAEADICGWSEAETHQYDHAFISTLESKNWTLTEKTEPFGMFEIFWNYKQNERLFRDGFNCVNKPQKPPLQKNIVSCFLV